jgi:rubrerythrin
MDKKEILKQLEEAAYWEDDFLEKYDNEEIWELLKAAVPLENYKKIRQLFHRNLADTKTHKVMLKMVNMISDINSMFKEVLKTEEEFIDLYGKLLGELKNAKVKKIITKIRDDEKLHAKNARKILKLLE